MYRMKYQHFAKRHRAQALKPNKWIDPVYTFKGKDRKRFYADAAGDLTAVLYAPIEFTGEEVGMVRVRLVRGVLGKKPVDPTGYDERVLEARDGFARIRFFYAGRAEKGRAYHWQIMWIPDASYNGPAPKLTGTHYADFWRR